MLTVVVTDGLWRGVTWSGASRSLGLGSNMFTGTVPDAFSKLATLKGLYLGNNRLSGSLPTVVTGMTSLSALDLSGTLFGGSVPSVYQGLTRLRCVWGVCRCSRSRSQSVDRACWVVWGGGRVGGGGGGLLGGFAF